MSKRITTVSIRVIIALVLGLVFASMFTHMQHPCTTTIEGEDITHCIEFSKAVMHPGELVHNKQHSLVKFSEILVTVFAASYILLAIYGRHSKKAKL